MTIYQQEIAAAISLKEKREKEIFEKWFKAKTTNAARRDHAEHDRLLEIKDDLEEAWFAAKRTCQ